MAQPCGITYPYLGLYSDKHSQNERVAMSFGVLSKVLPCVLAQPSKSLTVLRFVRLQILNERGSDGITYLIQNKGNRNEHNRQES
jgi:hypothetical protein